MQAPDRRLVRMATCVHEAGHTTASLVTGIEFVKVKVTSDDTGKVINRYEQIEPEMLLYQAMVSAAGLEAEQLFAARMGGEYASHLHDAAFGPAEHDMRNVRHFAYHAGFPLAVVRRKAHELMREHWNSVLLTAHALMKSPTMSYARTRSVAKVK